jgi:serine/threonine protein kinase
VSEELWAGPVEEPDRYTLWAVIGGGAEGKVYRATQALADGHLDVAVKVMLPDRFGAAGEPAEQVAARWADQAARLRNLRHPGLVGVQEAFLGPPAHPRGVVPEGRVAYFVMAWIEGRDFGSWLGDRPAGADRTQVLGNVADALDELHAAGQVHADVKPGNILVRTTTLPTGAAMEAAVLVDFGLMRAITRVAPSEVGYTAGYVAPELRHGQPYSPASDLYALGGVVLYALTGEHPSSEGDVVAEARRRLAAAGVPVATADAVSVALHPNPTLRPRGCRAWLNRARDGLSSSMTVVMTPVGTPPPPGSVGGPVVVPAEDAAPSTPKPKKERSTLSAVIKVAVSLTVTASAAVGGAKLADRGDDTQTAAPTTTERDDPTTTSTTRRTTTSTTDDTTDPTSPLLGNAVWLDEFDQVDSGGGFYAHVQAQTQADQAKLNGVPNLHSLLAWTGCETANAWADFDLSRDWSRFTTTVGIEDASSADSSVTFTVLLDGQPVASGDVVLGRPVEVDVDVSNGLRLRLDMVDNSCGFPDNSSINTTLVYGDPKLSA